MNDWLKLRQYLHFSPKFCHSDKKFIAAYVSSTEVKFHKFYPLIHYTIAQNSFKRYRLASGKKSSKRRWKKKLREIYYANHLDAQVYAYYSNILNTRLNVVYQSDINLNESVTAYRRIPISDNRNKCNIDFANDVFSHIRDHPNDRIDVVCLDITKFFDSLDHKILKKSWYRLLDSESSTLPPEHYNIFKSLTRFSFVEISDLISEFKEFKVKKFQYLKERKIKSFCRDGDEFRERVVAKGIIKYNNGSTKGIPQGTPISSTLSNLYMLEFDQYFTSIASQNKFLYRRYSDDMIIVCDPSYTQIFIDEMTHFLESKLKLTINKKKTQLVSFEKKLGVWSSTLIENGIKFPGLPLSYLGFDFDGKKITIRTKSISSYYRKTKRLIGRRARFASIALEKNKIAAKGSKPVDDWIYKHGIYKSKSHLGSKRKKINSRKYWGNYITYVNTASAIMQSPAIKHQLRNHWRIINRLIKKQEVKNKLPPTPKRRGKIKPQTASSTPESSDSESS